MALVRSVWYRQARPALLLLPLLSLSAVLAGAQAPKPYDPRQSLAPQLVMIITAEERTSWIDPLIIKNLNEPAPDNPESHGTFLVRIDGRDRSGTIHRAYWHTFLNKLRVEQPQPFNGTEPPSASPPAPAPK